MPGNRPGEPRYLEFDPERPDDVVATMDAMAAAGRGWVNFEPAVLLDDVPPAGGGFFGLFSGRGPDVPLATWTAPTAPRRGRGEPAMIGLQHGAGRRIEPHLAEMGQPMPDGWVVVQDYVKKGLVVSVPSGVPSSEVLEWLLAAARAVSSVPLEGMWRASVYEG
ncbi:MAG TPA: hypothetical protein VM942_06840 [Acidimicrobiales bacterium]|nr:hypothetical protein [Acidimicrobiales bacterium]